MQRAIQSIPATIKAIITMFLAIILAYLSHELTDPIFNLWTDSTAMYVVARLIYWMILGLIVWVLAFGEMWNKEKEIQELQPR